MLSHAVRTYLLLGRQPRIRRAEPPPIRFPSGAQLAYLRALRAVLEVLRKAIALEVLPALPRLLAAHRAERPDSHVSRVDNTGESADALFRRVEQRVEQELPEPALKQIAQRAAVGVSEFNRGQVENQIRSVVKIDVFATEQGIGPHVDAFVSQNVALIQGLADDARKQMHALVLQAAREGLRHNVVAKQIAQQFGIANKRAAAIAADQTAKLNGELTQLRQQALGIRRYKWKTSGDERVRRIHAGLNNTIQRWDAPPVVNKRGDRKNPGGDFRCRCSSIPIIEDVLEEAGLAPPSVPPSKLPANTQTSAAGGPRMSPRILAAPTGGAAGGGAAGGGAAGGGGGKRPKPPPTAAGVSATQAGLVRDRMPAWMRDKATRVSERTRLASRGVNDAELVTLDTPQGPRQGIWKTLEGSVDWKPMGISKRSIAQREEAAAALDRVLHGSDAVVPPTVERQLRGVRGSLQEFVPNAKAAMQLDAYIAADPQRFANAPDQRRTFLLDIITRNTDRHGGNLLWTEAEAAGVPRAHAIDNGYAFPSGRTAQVFRFPVNDPAYIATLLELDAQSVATLARVTVQELGATLRQYKAITREQRRDVLVRWRSLQKNPQQFAGFAPGEAEAKLGEWLARTPKAHGLTPAELKEIEAAL